MRSELVRPLLTSGLSATVRTSTSAGSEYDMGPPWQRPSPSGSLVARGFGVRQRGSATHFLRADAVFLSLAFWIASTNCFFFMLDRPEMPSFFARPSRWSFVAFASTPPAVFLFVFRPPAAWASDGPFLPPSFFSQWSPIFSKLCFTAAQATWLARFSSPYSPAAESWALANVRWAFFGERCRVLGSSDCLAEPLFVVFGIDPLLSGDWPSAYPAPAPRSHREELTPLPVRRGGGRSAGTARSRCGC